MHSVENVLILLMKFCLDCWLYNILLIILVVVLYLDQPYKEEVNYLDVTMPIFMKAMLVFLFFKSILKYAGSNSLLGKV